MRIAQNIFTFTTPLGELAQCCDECSKPELTIGRNPARRAFTMPPLANPTKEASVSLEMDGGKPAQRAGSAGLGGAQRLVLLAMVFIAFAFGLGGVIVGAVLTGRLNDLESKVDALQAISAHTHDKVHSLQDTAAITDGLVVTQSAMPPAGYTFGGSLNAGAGEWAPAVHLPEERSDLQAVACGGVIVVLGGINASSDVQNTAWAFDPVAEVTGPPTRTLAPALPPTLTLAPTPPLPPTRALIRTLTRILIRSGPPISRRCRPAASASPPRAWTAPSTWRAGTPPTQTATPAPASRPSTATTWRARRGLLWARSRLSRSRAATWRSRRPQA